VTDTEALRPAPPAAEEAALDPSRLDGTPAFEALVERSTRDRRVAAGNLWGSSQALVLARLVQRAQGPWLVVLATDAEAELFADDLACCGVGSELFPARESAGDGDDRSLVDPDTVRRRLQVAQRLAGPPERRPRLVVGSLLALLQPLP